MFDKSEIDPQFKEPKKRRKKGERPKPDKSKWKWHPSEEYRKMIYDSLIACGFPKTRIRMNKRVRYVRLLLRCRGADETHFYFRRFYTPYHVSQFLKLYFHWDNPERRPKRGRPRKPKVPRPRKPRALDRRTKAWRKSMLHKHRSPTTGILYPLTPKRRRK
jgi:hypothetical protein